MAEWESLSHYTQAQRVIRPIALINSNVFNCFSNGLDIAQNEREPTGRLAKTMCIECERLRNVSVAAADRLVEARANLARYRPPESSDEFSSLWNECQEALRESYRLREEMARHTAAHQPKFRSYQSAAD